LDDLITFWVNSGKRVGGSKVKLFVIKITASGIGHLVCTRLVAALRWQQGAGFVVPQHHRRLILLLQEKSENICINLIWSERGVIQSSSPLLVLVSRHSDFRGGLRNNTI